MDNKWCMLEEGYVHTTGLTYEEAMEMVKRYNSCYFPELEYCLFYDEHNEFNN